MEENTTVIVGRVQAEMVIKYLIKELEKRVENKQSTRDFLYQKLGRAKFEGRDDEAAFKSIMQICKELENLDVAMHQVRCVPMPEMIGGKAGL